MNLTPDLFLDKLIGERYRVKEFISGGGMGKVYQALDTRLANKIVAVKLLSQGLGGSSEAGGMLRRRFEEEAKLSAILGGHPRIIQVTDYGIYNSYPYIVMEYLGGGQSLSEVIRSGPMRPDRVLRIAIQVCEGLHHAHGIQTDLGDRLITGVVHRDIKPSNIFLMREGSFGETVKILDFGIAKAISDVSIALSSDRGFIGTCNYASPEQMRGEPLDLRSDIYSLGVVLYQMLTGEMPLRPKTSSFAGWYQVHNFEQPIAFNLHKLGTDVPQELVQLIMTCLAKDPEQRVPDMEMLRRALEAISQKQLSTTNRAATPRALSTIDADFPKEPVTRNLQSEGEETQLAAKWENADLPQQTAQPQKQAIWIYLAGGAVALFTSGFFFISSQSNPVQKQPNVATQPKSNPQPKPKPNVEDKTVPKPKVATDSQTTTPIKIAPPKPDSVTDKKPKPIPQVIIQDKPKPITKPQKDTSMATKPQPKPEINQPTPSPKPVAAPPPTISEAYVQDAGGIRRDIYSIGDTLYFVIRGGRNQLATVKLGKFGTFTMNPSVNDSTQYSIQIKVNSLSFPTTNDVKLIPIFRLCANTFDSICDKSIATAITISPR